MSAPETHTPAGAPPTNPTTADTAVAAALTVHDAPALWPPERALRLYACGCCRQVWDRLAPACKRAVIAAERYADGLARVDELARAWRACRRAEEDGRPVPVLDPSVGARFYQVTEAVHRVAAPVFTPADAEAVAADLRPWRGDAIENEEVDAACRAVRADVFGPPRAAGPGQPAWRTPAVLTLARAVYKGRSFDGLPALADALEEAGCDEPDLLAHFRGGSPPPCPARRAPEGVHVRGCWALDRVLGKR